MKPTRIRTTLGVALVLVLALLGLPGAASAAVPPAPTLAADVNTNKSVDLVWTPTAGATSYRICEDLYTPANGTGDCLGTTTDTQSRRGPLADGTYRYFVTAINADGESAASNKVTVSVPAPTGLPTVTVYEPQHGDEVSGLVTMRATTDEPDEDVIAYLIDGQVVADDAVGNNSDGYRETWDSTTVPDGRHYFQVRATDTDGESLTTAPDAVFVDNTPTTPAPTVSLAAPADNATVSGTTVTLDATTSADVDVIEYRLDGTVIADDDTPTNYDGWSDLWDSTAVADGTYSLTVVGFDLDTGAQATSAAHTVTVANGTTPPPPAGVAASFTASPTSGDAPLTVQFTDTSSGSPTSWAWDFDDGTSSTEQNPSHTFTDPGTYTVTLTATNADGADTTSASVTAHDTTSSPPPDPVTAPTVPGSGPVPANDETEAFASGTGDLADDPAIYVDPTDPTRSVVIGSKKAASGGGLGVYDLNGDKLSFFAGGELNNVDVRTVGDKVVVLTTERGNNTLKFFTYDPATRTLSDAGSIPTGFEPYGGCLYQSGTGLYGFVTNRNSGFDFDQYALTVGSSGVTGTKVRDLSTSSLSESCVADDEEGDVYLSQEDVGVYRYSADPAGGSSRTAVAPVGSHGVTADVEGLGIARGRGADHPDHLIVSSQGASTYQVFDLATGAFVRSFTVTASTDGTVDGVTGTDGLEVTRADLGPAYPDGLLVVHDTSNSGGTVSNFKLVDAGLVLGSYGGSTGGGQDPPPPSGVRGPGGSVTVWEDDFESGLDCGIWQRMQNNDTGPNGAYASSACTDLPSTGTPRGSFPADSGDQGTGDRAFRSEVRQGDLAASGERSELSGDGASWSFHEGDDLWLQERVMVEPTLTQEQNGRFYILNQWHAGSGSPPLTLNIEDDGSLTVGSNGAGTVPYQTVMTGSEFTQGVWFDLSVHFVMSLDPNVGGVEVWVDGQQAVPWTSGQTMADGGSYLKLGQYRDPQPDTGVVYFDDVRLSHD